MTHDQIHLKWRSWSSRKEEYLSYYGDAVVGNEVMDGVIVLVGVTGVNVKVGGSVFVGVEVEDGVNDAVDVDDDVDVTVAVQVVVIDGVNVAVAVSVGEGVMDGVLVGVSETMDGPGLEVAI